MDILNSIVINYYLIYICLIYCQINANGISIGPSKTLTNSYVGKCDAAANLNILKHSFISANIFAFS